MEATSGDPQSSPDEPADESMAEDSEAGRLLDWPQLELERVNSFLTSRLEEIKNTIKDSIRASFSMYDLNLDVNDFPKKAATLEGNHLLSHLNGSTDIQQIDLDLAPLSFPCPRPRQNRRRTIPRLGTLQPVLPSRRRTGSSSSSSSSSRDRSRPPPPPSSRVQSDPPKSSPPARHRGPTSPAWPRRVLAAPKRETDRSPSSWQRASGTAHARLRRAGRPDRRPMEPPAGSPMHSERKVTRRCGEVDLSWIQRARPIPGITKMHSSSSSNRRVETRRTKTREKSQAVLLVNVLSFHRCILTLPEIQKLLHLMMLLSLSRGCFSSKRR